MKDFEKNIGRFNAEFGFQSFPEFSTLNSFSDTSDWKLNSKVMKHHQKSYVGNGMILKHAMELF
jgi:beta-mannosidase